MGEPNMVAGLTKVSPIVAPPRWPQRLSTGHASAAVRRRVALSNATHGGALDP
jgi:hypothetical protein